MLAPDSLRPQILDELARIERDEGVLILLAVESGSRAWGFPSPDSDFDVRFVYARPPTDYIAVFEPRDVIERPISGVLDVNGWDVKKALGLLRKSNPALLEWLRSRIVYREHSAAAAYLRRLSDTAFIPLASCHHYRSMMRQHQRRGAGDSDVRFKRYLYALRPLLAARFVLEKGISPPMEFQELVDTLVPAGRIRTIIDHLVALKSRSLETDVVARIPELDDYLDEEITRIERNLPAPSDGWSKAQCNSALREVLALCFDGKR